jgi:hypothetical protein
MFIYLKILYAEANTIRIYHISISWIRITIKKFYPLYYQKQRRNLPNK